MKKRRKTLVVLRRFLGFETTRLDYLETLGRGGNELGAPPVCGT